MVQLASSPIIRPGRVSNTAGVNAASKPQTWSEPKTKQNRVAPKLVVLDQPQAAKSSAPFTIICSMVLLGALIAGLLLNISMSNTSYQITNLQAELQGLNEQAQSLEEQVELLGTPQELEKQARALGMEPATEVQYIDLASKQIVGSANLDTLRAANSVKLASGSSVLIPGEAGLQYGMGNERN